MRYELKLQDGSVVEMSGEDGEDASRRYVDLHRDSAVVAWREPRHGMRVLGRHSRIIQ